METTIKTIVHNINLETAQLQENLEKFEKGNSDLTNTQLLSIISLIEIHLQILIKG